MGVIITDAKTLAGKIDAFAYLNPISDVVKMFRPNGLRVGNDISQNVTF